MLLSGIPNLRGTRTRWPWSCYKSSLSIDYVQTWLLQHHPF